MNFLAPLFLLGALVIAAPLLFHLSRKTTREVTHFSTLMFLQPTPPRASHRSRLENLWLLLLRCLILALLALSFSRPFMRSQSQSAASAAAGGKRIVLLLDTSASMRRENLWDQAQERATRVAQQMNAGDLLAIMSFGGRTALHLSFEEWNRAAPESRTALALERIQSLTPSWASTRLDEALIGAAETLAQSDRDAADGAQIVVISDLQEGSRVDALQGFDWPRGVAVSFERVEAKRLGNASLQWIADLEESTSPTAGHAPRIRVAASPESTKEQFSVRRPKPGAAPLVVYVPPGQSRIVRPPADADALSGPVTLAGDEIDFDNTLHTVPPGIEKATILFLGSDLPNDSRGLLFYLQRAFPSTARQTVNVTAHRGLEPLASTVVDDAQLLVIGDASESALPAAATFARKGGIVLAPLTSTASVANLARTLARPELAATEGAVKDYALLAQIDFHHPLFAAFADPRFGDFTKLHFWKYRQLASAALPGAQVLASFDNGDPAVLQVPLGSGSVVVFTSSWLPADSQLALSSKFVPLLHALLEQSGRRVVQKAQYFVGDQVLLGEPGSAFTVRKPDGSEVPAAAGKFSATDEPGIYTVVQNSRRFAVNLAPEESRTSPLPPERFSSLGVPAEAGVQAQRAAATAANLQDADVESRQKTWRWLMAAAVAILLGETLLAARLSFRTPTPSAAPQT